MMIVTLTEGEEAMTNKPYESNYDKVRENWRQKFLAMAKEALTKRFGLEWDDDALYLEYFSNRMRIDSKTGEITYADRPDRKLTFNTAISIYNLFYYAADAPAASGRMVLFREVKRAYPFEQAYRQTILKKVEECFAGRVDLLKAACEKLCGTALPQGDAGYVIPVFPFLNMAILFWDEDEEFPAKANMLFDSNVTDFMHEENVVGIASDLVYYLTEAAGLGAEEIYGG